ncbi:LuxR C-terminal-related transcriptional regulator [Kribbella sp. CWNU-51]
MADDVLAKARADLAAELGEAHAATLATLLGVLRNQRIDADSARSTAVELALNELHISESTVKFHVANILTKLAVTSRTQAAALYHATAAVQVEV